MSKTPLAGVRVVDFSWVVAGPMTTKMLAAMGAEVIKIESTLRPEYTNRAGHFPILNPGKLSCTINIGRAEGQALLHKLVAVSDIVVENFSRTVLERNQLGYDHLSRIKRDIIFCSASGVGREGPLRDVLAYGSLLQGFGGRTSLIGKVNLHLEAMGILPAWTDPVTAMWETIAILAALRHRGETGEGAFIDLSMLESTVALLPGALMNAALEDTPEVIGGNDEPDSAPGGCFPCAGAEEWIALSVRSDAEWQGLCRAMEREDLAGEKALTSQQQRLAQKDRLNAEAIAFLAGKGADEAEALLLTHGVPASRSRSFADQMDADLLSRRNLFPETPDGSRTVALPWQDDSGWRGTFTPPPALGADNEYVFGTLLGLPAAEIRHLMEEGVIK